MPANEGTRTLEVALDIDAAVYAGDEKPFRAAFLQQGQAGLQAQASAGQYDDCIGCRRGVVNVVRQCLQESEQSGAPEQDQRDRQREKETSVSLRPACHLAVSAHAPKGAQDGQSGGEHRAVGFRCG